VDIVVSIRGLTCRAEVISDGMMRSSRLRMTCLEEDEEQKLGRKVSSTSSETLHSGDITDSGIA